MKTKLMEITCGLFLWFADVIPDIIEETFSVNESTALAITEDLVQMALKNIEQKRSKHYGNKES